MHLLHQPQPLTQEYAGFFLLRYPKLREAYESFLSSAAERRKKYRPNRHWIDELDHGRGFASFDCRF